MDKETLGKLFNVADALDEYAVRHSGNADLATLTGRLIVFLAQFDPQNEIPEPERQYTLTEVAELLG